MFGFRIFERLAAALPLVAILLAATGTAGAQQVVGGIPVGPDGEPLGPEGRAGSTSRFNLFGDADFARSMINPGHDVSYCLTNDGNAGGVGCPWGAYARPGDGVGTLSYRQGSWMWGVPRSEWLKARELAPSLNNVKDGSGYTVMGNINANALGPRIRPKDGSLGLHHNNVTAASGGCAASHNWVTSNVHVPLSTCPPTVGPAGWLGAQEIPREAFLEAFAADPNGFRFDFWTMPGAYAEGELDPDRTLGSAAGYAFESDWTNEKAQNYGSVVPASGLTTAPQDNGWPLGLEVRTDAFAFDLPALRNIVFYQSVITNRSDQVYNVGLDYDSLYIGWASGAWFHGTFQNSSAYVDLAKGAYKSTISGVVQAPPCHGKPTITDIVCGNAAQGPIGDRFGSHAIIFLKSPIGDLRNKLFTMGDAESNPFHDPSHPLAGDTITFNHHHMCGFRQCNQTTFQRALVDDDGMRKSFGMLASIEEDVLGDRALGTLADATYWHTFRSEQFPTRSGFNRYTVPNWNSSLGFTEVAVDPCGTNGCVEAWNDTLPNITGGPGFINAYNNTGQITSVGPIRLAAGESTGFVLAFATSLTSKDVLETMIDRAIDAYMTFFLAPKPAPPPQVRAVTLNPDPDPRQRSIDLFLSLEPLAWTDPYLDAQADAYSSGERQELNPELEGRLRDRAANNVRAIHIFKSCNNGNAYTVSADCSPARATAGRFGALGWLPAMTFETAAGPVPTVVRDGNVTPGRTYLYVAVAETWGAEFVVLSPTGPGGSIAGELIEFAPSLFNSLTNNTDLPNVVAVRLPASIAAGSAPAATQVVAQAGGARIAPDGFEPLSFSMVGAGQVGGDYRVVFGDSVLVTGPADGSAATTVTLYRGDAPTAFNTSGVVTLNGVPADGDGATAGLSAVLAVDGQPLLVTRTLTGASATPGAFVAAPNFPGFFLDVHHRPGEFAEQFYTVPRATGRERMDPNAAPSLIWSTAKVARAPGRGLGEYTVAWTAGAFGPLAPFSPNFGNPSATASDLAASLGQRQSAGTTIAPTAEQVAALAAALRALNNGADSLLAARISAGDAFEAGASLPFTIRNATAGTDVSVAMLKRSTDQITLTTSSGSVAVDVPASHWLPGDTLFFFEGGQPTWARAVIECGALAPPARCNPVPASLLTTGNTTPTVFASPDARHEQVVRYYTGFDGESEYTIRVVPPRTTADASAADVVAAMRNVRVVPNPYVVNALTDATTQQRILFTGLPQSGRIRIYSLSGVFLQELAWSGAGSSGDTYFNLRTREGNLLASGLYLFVAVATDDAGNDIPGARKNGKFVVIR